MSIVHAYPTCTPADASIEEIYPCAAPLPGKQMIDLKGVIVITPP